MVCFIQFYFFRLVHFLDKKITTHRYTIIILFTPFLKETELQDQPKKMIEIKSVILILFCYYFCSNDSTIAAFTFYRHSTTNVYDNRNVIKNREWQRKGELYAFNDGGVLISSNMNNANDRDSGVEKLPKVLPNGGRVTLVGSGPGDPELLTLSAYKLLTNEDDENNCADEIIVDRLVSKEILDLIPSTKVVRIAKKYPGCAEQAQQEIYSWVENAVQKGKHVVRLKIGDPFVFGRGGEEVLKFRSFGVEPHVIPVSISFICLAQIVLSHIVSSLTNTILFVNPNLYTSYYCFVNSRE